MTWLEAAGHYNWLMFRDGKTSYEKKLRAQAYATAVVVCSYPTYLFMSHEDISFFLGIFLSIIFFGLITGCCWLFYKFKSNTESFAYMVGLMEKKGIKKVDYDHRHYIYDSVDYVLKYDEIADYSFEKVDWKEWSFINLRIKTKDEKVLEIGIPKDFFDKESPRIKQVLELNISEYENHQQTEARS